MADREQLKRAIVAAHAAGDRAAVLKLGEAYKAAAQPQFTPTGPGAITEESDRTAVENAGGGMAALRGAGKALLDMGAGAIRGAGSIGATVVAPADMLMDKALPLRSGQTRNSRRRAAITSALGKLGADTNSAQFTIGKVGGEIAGTAGAGGVVANAARLAPGAARVPALINAIETGGMRAGGIVGGASIPARVIGGATSGGAQAGLVDPSQAGTGAMIGGALPVVVGGAGRLGQAAGRLFRGTEQTPELQQAIAAARQAGYVIPPTQARPTLGNRVLEGFSGKITTAQNASARNQTVTNRLAAEAIGVPADVPITPDILTAVRNQAGQAYQRIGAIGQITPSRAYGASLDAIAAPFRRTAAAFPNRAPSPVIELVEGLNTPAMDAADAVEVVKQLRSQADDAFRGGNTDVGRAARAAANAVESELERQLVRQGNPALLDEFRQARQLIARTYSVERALNPSTGTINAKQLAAQLKKGKPLSGGLRDAAEFSSRFPTASQPVEAMGSLPQMSPLDWAVAGLSGGGAMMGGGVPAGVAMFARPAVRAGILSAPIQNSLIQPAARQGGTNNMLTQGLRYALPVAGSGQ